MRKHEKSIQISLLYIVAVLLAFTGCSEVNNTDNYAVVSGRVLNSVSDPTGVPGVVVWVESDPSSNVAYLGGDVSVTTDENGEYRAEVFLGYLTIRDRPEEGEGGTFSVDFPQFVGDARVIMFYQDSFLDLGGGFTIQRGNTLEIWDVYLTEFFSVTGDTTRFNEHLPRFEN